MNKIKLIREEQGLTLLEVIVTVIIVGIALPSLFVLIGNLSYQSFQNRVMTQSVNLANNRMEEIQAFKDSRWDWYKSINDYVEIEDVEGYTRTTEVSYHSDWDDSDYEAYQVEVNVSHPKFPNGYNLTTYLTLYSK
ncbi:MAG: prepilin-type N-terminal cleavage/methylation domain-containing protein [Calditrichaeota bacterium]|nr:prepilin-type N-terminal cleavage/methylation domain-containing protein [Calditrichota bacterium]